MLKENRFDKSSLAEGVEQFLESVESRPLSDWRSIIGSGSKEDRSSKIVIHALIDAVRACNITGAIEHSVFGSRSYNEKIDRHLSIQFKPLWREK